MKKIGLLPRIIIAIALGVGIGLVSPAWMIRIFATFNDLFGNFLGFIIPLIIIGFIAPGIGSMGRGAGKLLGISAGVAYVSTIIAGLLAFIAASILFPTLLKNQSLAKFGDPSEALLSGYLTIEMPPIMDVMPALLLSFILGLGMAALNSDSLLNVMENFRTIIEKLIEKVIIPLLPIHIFGIFANMTHAGQVQTILSVFAKVFVIIISLHILYLFIQYSAAGATVKQNPFSMIKTMLPAYFTALGTQSSASTIPVTLKHAKKLKVRPQAADFCVPLFATIHLSGSMITLTSCSIAVMMLMGKDPAFGAIFPFILLLGVTMVAAPGVPGGAVMAALGVLESMLAFDPTMLSLMIALYLAQDSFGTACNVTGDGAITVIADQLTGEAKVSPKLAAQ